MTGSKRAAIDCKRSLANAAYGFNIVATVFLAFFLITMAWAIPMTVRTQFHSLHPTKSHCLALGICSILFLAPFGIIAGILLIITYGKTFGLTKK